MENPPLLHVRYRLVIIAYDAVDDFASTHLNHLVSYNYPLVNSVPASMGLFIALEGSSCLGPLFCSSL